MITQTLQLNLVPKGVWPRLYVSQYDAGSRTLTFEIYNGDQRFTLTSGTTAKIQGTKPDRHGFSYDAEVDTSNNIITIDITQQMTAAHGEAYCELVLFKSGQRIGTLNFVMMIQQAGLNDGTDTSDSDLPDIIAEATEQMLTAEAYAKGTRNGTAVTSGQTGYHDNSKYYKEQAATQASNASTSATNANTNALKAEGYAVGKQNGTTQTSGTYYHNNAQYYKEQAADSATTASTKAGEASTSANTASQKASAASTSAQTASDKSLVAEGYAKGTQNGTPVGSTSPYYHNNAEYFKNLANPTVAANVSFNNSGTDMSSTNVQDGIVENRTSIQNLSNYVIEKGVKNIVPPFSEKYTDETTNQNCTLTENSGVYSFTSTGNYGRKTMYFPKLLKVGKRYIFVFKKKFTTSNNIGCSIALRGVNGTYADSGNIYFTTASASDNDFVQISQSFTAEYEDLYVMFYVQRGTGSGNKIEIKDFMIFDESITNDPTYEPYSKTNQQLTQETTGLIDNQNVNGAVNFHQVLNTSQVINGITWTVNDDETVTANGTATADSVFKTQSKSAATAYYDVGMMNAIAGKTIRFSGCPKNGSSSTYFLRLYIANDGGSKDDFGDGYNRTISSNFPNLNFSVECAVKSGQTVSNLVFKPMISVASLNLSYDDYVPYAKSNKEFTDLWKTNKYVEYDVTGGETTWLDFTNATRKLLVNTFTRHCFLTIQNVTTVLALSTGMVRGVASLPHSDLYKPPYNTYGVGRVIKDGTLYSKVVFSKNSINNAIAMVAYEDIPAGAEISFNIEWMY